MNMRLCGTDPFAVMKKPHGFRLASLIPPVDRGGARIPACPLGRHPCRRVEPRMPAEPAGKMPALPVLGSWPHLLRKWDWRKRSPTPALSPRRDLPEMKIRASKPLNRGKTSNIQRGHRMAARILAHFDVRCSMLDVRCWMFLRVHGQGEARTVSRNFHALWCGLASWGLTSGFLARSLPVKLTLVGTSRGDVPTRE